MIDNMKCPRCGSERMIKSGISWSGRNKRQRYGCLDCHSVTIKPDQIETEATPVDEIASVDVDDTNVTYK